MAVENPTLAWPVSVEADGSYAAVPADSDHAALQAVARVCQVEQGAMRGRPGMGLPAMELLAGRPDPDAVRELLEDQVPYADVTVLAVPEPGEGWAALRVEVSAV